MMELWPFTNFHDMNLDWIIRRIKNVEDSEAAAKASAEAAAGSMGMALFYSNRAKNSAEDAAASAEDARNAALAWLDTDTFTNAIGGAITDYIDDNGIGFTLKVNYKTRSGYISSNGGYAPAGDDTQEVFTNKLPCFPGDTVTMKFTWTSTESKWVTACFFDENGSFVSRSGTLYGSSGTSYEGTFTIPADSYFYAVTWRTYGESTAEFSYNGSVYDIRNRIDKGLTHQDLFGGFDRVRLNDPSETFTGDVLLPGLAYITDFIQIPDITGTDSVTTNINSAYNNSYMILYFDSAKDYISHIAWTTNYHLTEQLPSGCEFVRFGFYNTATFDSIMENFSYTFNSSLTVDYSSIAWLYGENVKSVNHRGYESAPENTLPAYKLSKRMGFKYAETDISYTSDGVAVLLHDESINRTARNMDGTTISQTIDIDSITYQEALGYDFGIYKGTAYAGTPIPTFEQFIALCKNIGLHPYIELKNGLTESRARALVDMAERYGMTGHVTWISSNLTWLTYIKNYDANARLGYVVGNVTSAIITTAQNLRTGTNEVFIDCYGIDSPMVTACMNANMPVEIWTANTEEQILALDPYITGMTCSALVASQVLYEANI